MVTDGINIKLCKFCPCNLYHQKEIILNLLLFRGCKILTEDNGISIKKMQCLSYWLPYMRILTVP
jgi:hypothetical protein